MEPSPPPDPEVVAPGHGDGLAGPQPSAGPSAAQPAARPKRRLRQVLVVVFSIITLLCLGGGAALFVYYDKATAPDLSSPALVTRKYLAAYLLDRDDVKAAQFRCADDGGLADVRALRSDIDSRQTTYKIKITVSIDSVTETSRSDTTATTTADIVLSTVIDGKSQSAVEHWVFSLKDGGGWLVCSGHEQI